MSKVRWLSAAAGTAIFVGAFALPGSGVAYAATSDGPLSILSGDTANAPVNIPVTLCGVTVSLLGGSSAQCDGSSTTNTTINNPSSPGGAGGGAGGGTSIGSNDTVNAPVSAPVTVCGVAAAVGGGARSHCVGDSSTNTRITNNSSPSADGSGPGGLSILSGDTANAPISIPVTACGAAVAILGQSDAGCLGGDFTNTTVTSAGTGTSGRGGSGRTLPGGVIGGGGLPVGGSTGGRGPSGRAPEAPGPGGVAVGSGDTVNAPVSIPVTACGIAVAALGQSHAGCAGVSSTNTRITNDSAPSGGRGPGGLSILSGDTVNAPVSIPVTACGIAVAALGQANAGCLGVSSTNTNITNSSGGTAPGGISILSGDTVNAPISVPVTACGIAVAALGQADAGCLGSSAVNPVPPSCHALDCNGIPPVGCHGSDCTTTPPGGCTTNCHTGGCTTNCGGTPPGGCQGACGGGTPPGGTPPGGTPPGGTTPGHGGTGSGSGGHGTPPGTATVSTTSLPSNLPTTGANLLALLLAGGGALVVGTGTVLLARRRQTGEIA